MGKAYFIAGELRIDQTRAFLIPRGSKMITLQDVQEAERLIRPYIRHTPLLHVHHAMNHVALASSL
jgi:hypothetical protein